MRAWSHPIFDWFLRDLAIREDGGGGGGEVGGGGGVPLVLGGYIMQNSVNELWGCFVTVPPL